MSSVEVRPVGAADWAVWREIRLRSLEDSPDAYGSTYDRELGFTESDWRSRLGADSPAMLAFAEETAGPVGMGGGYRDLPGWLHVVAMWTLPAWRGRGVGRAVLAAIEQWAAARDLRVHLDVALGNPGARTAYERCGYVATGETRPIREGSTDLVERMVRDHQPDVARP